MVKHVLQMVGQAIVAADFVFNFGERQVERVKINEDVFAYYIS